MTPWRAYRSRSRTRQQESYGPYKEKSKEEAFPNFETMQISGGGEPPWNKSTPSRRLTLPEAKEMDKQPSEAARATAPSSSAAPATLRDCLEIMRTQFQDQLPPGLRTVVDQYAQGEGDGLVEPQLTHAHLNRAKNAKVALTKARAKVCQLDGQWLQFVKVVKANFAQQFATYQSKRKEAVDNMRLKHQKWQEAQADIQKASKTNEALKGPDHNARSMEEMSEEQETMPWDMPEFAPPNVEMVGSEDEEIPDMKENAKGSALAPFRDPDGHPQSKVPRIDAPNP